MIRIKKVITLALHFLYRLVMISFLSSCPLWNTISIHTSFLSNPPLSHMGIINGNSFYELVSGSSWSEAESNSISIRGNYVKGERSSQQRRAWAGLDPIRFTIVNYLRAIFDIPRNPNFWIILSRLSSNHPLTLCSGKKLFFKLFM